MKNMEHGAIAVGEKRKIIFMVMIRGIPKKF